MFDQSVDNLPNDNPPPIHWTYQTRPSGNDDLQQGDILKPTDNTLVEEMKKLFPNMVDDSVLAFLIITQSCDLVQRSDGQSQTKLIQISPIQSISELIHTAYKKKFGCFCPTLYDANRKKSILNLTERVINQNETTLGLFYFHPEADAGISVEAVALLRKVLTFDSNTYYEKFQKIRSGRLGDSFQARLGWMVGHLYSRVGVKDWNEAPIEREKEMNRILGSSDEQPIWVNEKVWKQIEPKVSEFCRSSFEEKQKMIKEVEEKPLREKVINRIISILSNKNQGLSDLQKQDIQRKLESDDQLASYLKKLSDHC